MLQDTQDIQVTEDDINELTELLRDDPAKALAAAPAILGSAPSAEQAEELLDDAKSALRAPDVAVSENIRTSPYTLPQSHRFCGYDSGKIPIYLHQTKFEKVADWGAWASTAIQAWLFRLKARKPPMPRHSCFESGFCYDLKVDGKGVATIGLFSDWGTGYYHSQYIAKHISSNLDAKQAIHLGDVYYTGCKKDFERCITPVFEEYILKRMPFYALNANHEMDSHGIPYFKFLEDKREKGKNGIFNDQPQEGSYFCLSNQHYQVIGIDTAYHQNGRYRQEWLRDWLSVRLEQGRQEGKVNILLSQNEPYAKKVTKLLSKDLARDVVDEKLVDLWFWGDEHYCALYGPSEQAPFVGSCIGHGGFPYSLKSCSHMKSVVAPLLWGETAPRFPEEPGVRPGRGNNGFCYLTLAENIVELTYYDWRFDKRHYRKYQVQNGKLIPEG